MGTRGAPSTASAFLERVLGMEGLPHGPGEGYWDGVREAHPAGSEGAVGPPGPGGAGRGDASSHRASDTGSQGRACTPCSVLGEKQRMTQ